MCCLEVPGHLTVECGASQADRRFQSAMLNTHVSNGFHINLAYTVLGRGAAVHQFKPSAYGLLLVAQQLRPPCF
jgi:hypothetical protein